MNKTILAWDIQGKLPTSNIIAIVIFSVAFVIIILSIIYLITYKNIFQKVLRSINRLDDQRYSPLFKKIKLLRRFLAQKNNNIVPSMKSLSGAVHKWYAQYINIIENRYEENALELTTVLQNLRTRKIITPSLIKQVNLLSKKIENDNLELDAIDKDMRYIFDYIKKLQDEKINIYKGIEDIDLFVKKFPDDQRQMSEGNTFDKFKSQLIYSWKKLSLEIDSYLLNIVHDQSFLDDFKKIYDNISFHCNIFDGISNGEYILEGIEHKIKSDPSIEIQRNRIFKFEKDLLQIKSELRQTNDRLWVEAVVKLDALLSDIKIFKNTFYFYEQIQMFFNKNQKDIYGYLNALNSTIYNSVSEMIAYNRNDLLPEDLKKREKLLRDLKKITFDTITTFDDLNERRNKNSFDMDEFKIDLSKVISTIKFIFIKYQDVMQDLASKEDKMNDFENLINENYEMIHTIDLIVDKYDSIIRKKEYTEKIIAIEKDLKSIENSIKNSDIKISLGKLRSLEKEMDLLVGSQLRTIFNQLIMIVSLDVFANEIIGYTTAYLAKFDETMAQSTIDDMIYDYETLSPIEMINKSIKTLESLRREMGR
ncbi:hypothetical protein [Mesoplasma photuris]|uniref:hypothetical protein n=1 Tax=Mesoplasma photuris TaxID=217731 RepID=UPI0004E17CC3|nr:hypothetical protein [Mesoplasma photuris]